MKKVKIIDQCFSHAFSTSWYNKPKYFQWERVDANDLRGYVPESVFLTDQSIYSKIEAKRKIAFLIEPPAINPGIYDWIKKTYEDFDYVLTHKKELLKIDKRFLFYPMGGCWIPENERKVHKKSKLVSIIASGKNLTEGHRFRNEIVLNFGNRMDVYGHSFRRIENKIEGLRDYMFSVAVMNSCSDDYFTEILLDCFATGTVPIFWGSEKVSNYFIGSGLIFFDTIRDLNFILNDLDEDRYKSVMDFVRMNFDLSKHYWVAEDYIWENYPFLFS